MHAGSSAGMWTQFHHPPVTIIFFRLKMTINSCLLYDSNFEKTTAASFQLVVGGETPADLKYGFESLIYILYCETIQSGQVMF